jgi:hypothetical protein
VQCAVRFTEQEELLALGVLLRHSPGEILPDRTYVISEKAVRALREAGISFTSLGPTEDATWMRDRR